MTFFSNTGKSKSTGYNETPMAEFSMATTPDDFSRINNSNRSSTSNNLTMSTIDMQRRLGHAGVSNGDGFSKDLRNSRNKHHTSITMAPLVQNLDPTGRTDRVSYSSHVLSRMSDIPIDDLPEFTHLGENSQFTEQLESTDQPELLKRLYALRGLIESSSSARSTIESRASVALSHILQQDEGVLHAAMDERQSFLFETCRDSELKSHEKMRYIFNLFDVQGKNSITKLEIMAFLRVNYKNTALNLSGTTFDEIIDSIFSKYGVQDSDEAEKVLDFQQFKNLFMDNILGDTSVKQPKDKMVQLREVDSDRPQQVSMSDNWRRHNFKLKGKSKSKSKAAKYYRRHGAKALFLTFYFCLNACAFLIKFLGYKYDPLVGYYASIAKGFSQTAVLNCCLAILPMCREVVAYLRQSQWLWKFIPFDENIEFHKLCGIMVVISSIGHTLMWVLIVLKTKSVPFQDIRWRTSQIAHIEVLRPGRELFDLTLEIPIWTGILMIACMSLALPFTLKSLRRGNFNLFWFTHMLFLPFLLLLLIHGVSQWMNPPQAYLWIGFPCLIYFLERRYRLGKIFGSHPRIVKVHQTSDMVALFFTKPKRFHDFHPGMYLYVNIPVLSKFEWHPFTISSAPQDELLSVHIRRNGDWTNALHTLIESIERRGSSKETKEYPAIQIDGPVGAPSQEYHRHRIVMLIGAGIGVTPFASILKNVLNMWEDHRCCNCGTIQHPHTFQILKIYFYWVTREQESLSWFSDMMSQLCEVDADNRLEIHNYISSISRSSLVAPLELLQTFVHQTSGADIISGFKNTSNLTHFGRPQWKSIVENIASSHPNEEIGVFLCGPPKLDNTMANVCEDYNQTSKFNVKFAYHSENF